MSANDAPRRARKARVAIFLFSMVAVLALLFSYLLEVHWLLYVSVLLLVLLGIPLLVVLSIVYNI